PTSPRAPRQAPATGGAARHPNGALRRPQAPEGTVAFSRCRRTGLLTPSWPSRTLPPSRWNVPTTHSADGRTWCAHGDADRWPVATRCRWGRGGDLAVRRGRGGHGAGGHGRGRGRGPEERKSTRL